MSDIKTAVKKIMEYEWDWYKSVPETEWTRNPFLVIAPEGDSTSLRVYANGGNIASIPTGKSTGKNKGKKADKSYSNYCLPCWNDRNDKKNIIPEEFIEKYGCVYKEKEKSKKRIEDILDTGCLDWEKDKEFFDFATLASTNKFRKKDGTKGERWVQQAILRNMFTKKKYDEGGEDQTILFDMEYKIDLPSKRLYVKPDGAPIIEKNKKTGKKEEQWSKDCKPDFIAFDAKNGTFGLVEMKYNGDSMGAGSKNSLLNHYLDFHAVIADPNSAKKMKTEFLRRMWFLLHYGIVDTSWEKAFRTYGINMMETDYEKFLYAAEKKAEADDNNRIWAGFLFVDDKNAGEGYEKQMDKQLNEAAIKDQGLCTELSNMKYMYFQGNACRKTINVIWKDRI